jgi:hypothetical protein
MTENYWSRNDQFKGFFRKYIEKVEPVAGCASPNVGVQESYDKFKAFLMYNNPSKSMRIPAIQIFIDNMVRSMGEPVDDKWFGFKFRVQCHVNILAPGGAGPSEGAFVPT